MVSNTQLISLYYFKVHGIYILSLNMKNYMSVFPDKHSSFNLTKPPLKKQKRPCTGSPISCIGIPQEKLWSEIWSRKGLGNLEIRPRAAPRPVQTMPFEAGHRFNWSWGRCVAKNKVSDSNSGPKLDQCLNNVGQMLEKPTKKHKNSSNLNFL